MGLPQRSQVSKLDVLVRLSLWAEYCRYRNLSNVITLEEFPFSSLKDEQCRRTWEFVSQSRQMDGFFMSRRVMHCFFKIKDKKPLEIEVARRYKLFTLFTLFKHQTALHCLNISMYAYIYC